MKMVSSQNLVLAHFCMNTSILILFGREVISDILTNLKDCLPPNEGEFLLHFIMLKSS